MKKLVFAIFLVLGPLLFGCAPVVAESYQRPVFETIDLFVSSAQNISLTNDYSEIISMVFVLEFVDSSVNFSHFGDGSALANGIDFRYKTNGIEYSFFDAEVINTINDFVSHTPYQLFKSDDSNNHIYNFALDITLDNSTEQITEFFVMIQDNLQVNGITQFYLLVDGYQKVVTTYFRPITGHYFIGELDELIIEDLIIGKDYYLSIRDITNVLDFAYYNFTATHEVANIQYRYSPLMQKLNTSTLNISLYTGTGLYLDSIYQDFITVNDQLRPLTNLNQEAVIFGFVLFAGFILVIFKKSTAWFK